MLAAQKTTLMEQNLYIGKRQSYGGNICTLRYVGEVKGTQGQWLGVEWDEPTRGKHSGEHGEGRSKHPTSGSFVRPNRPTDIPHSFLEALNAKYASDGSNTSNISHKASENGAGHQTLLRQGPVHISGKIAEEIGFDKVRQQLANLNELRIVILDGMNISQLSQRIRTSNALGNEDSVLVERIMQISPKISELDLSRNLFEDWTEISYICSQLGHLRSLRLDGNRFRDVLSDPSSYPHEIHLEKVLELSLSNTLSTWQEIAHLTSRFFGKLVVLAASGNELSHISEHRLPHTLCTLELEDNDLTALSGIKTLADLPNLQRLSLRNNKFCRIADSQSVSVDKSNTGSRQNVNFTFSESLSEIDLSYNAISDWSFISDLHGIFPGMTSLRIAHNPLFENSRTPDDRSMTADDGYAVAAARLPRLKSLNFSQVTAKYRLNAETYYLSLIAAEMAAVPKGQESAVTRRHWRYDELCKEYGDPVVSRPESTLDPNSLAARLVRLHFRLAEHATALVKEGSETDFVLEFPKSLQVYSVLGYVGKRLGVTPMKIKLIWETDEWDPIKKAGDSDSDEDEDEDDNDDEEATTGQDRSTRMMRRDVVVVAGTRAIGTWIESSEAIVRVELMDSTWHSSSGA
ncbi:MAG: hypothetical protein Q9165_004455 [Trypethelium subeluteriae]